MDQELSHPPDDPLIGRELDGRYRIVRSVGSGGMGSVYEAEHLALGKRVAIKVIRAELVADEETRARFEREARATAQIEHPHVTTGMDFGRLPDGGAYLVVQLVRGTSLRDRIAEGPMPWREACTIGAQIADALAAIHAAGFVHRDLTPGNVLVARREDGSPHVHVLDLGVAALTAESSDGRLTETGRVVGTTGYMAPEQALGQRVDARADLYSLG
ncbi:MAG: serine/threonine protein kinase, partial [Sandaracinaceae bacterium]|nr:serine/threonine protein kinase [Sandaracinaceae bacterium]